jgi:hypothetical protein
MEKITPFLHNFIASLHKIIASLHNFIASLHKIIASLLNLKILKKKTILSVNLVINVLNLNLV